LLLLVVQLLQMLLLLRGLLLGFVLLPLIAIDAAGAIRTTALATGTTTAATAVAQQVGLAGGQGEARIVGINNCPLQTWEGERERDSE